MSDESIQVVLFIHRKSPDIIKQSYDQIAIVNSADGTAPEFFQAAMNQYKFEGIYGFLSEHDYLTSEDSIAKVVECIDNPYIGGVYSDSYLRSFALIPQIFPSFSRDAYLSSIINTPLFISSSVACPWNTKLKTAYFFDYFKRVGAQSLLAHIPQPLVITDYHSILQEEINEVNQQYG